MINIIQGNICHLYILNIEIYQIKTFFHFFLIIFSNFLLINNFYKEKSRKNI